MDKTNRKNNIIKLHDNGTSYVDIGKIFNISKQRVHQIISSQKNIRRVLSEKLVEMVKNYYENKCVICGDKKENLIIHHIDENPSNNSLINLVLLCRSCHGSIHGSKIKKIKNKSMEVKQMSKLGGLASAKSRFKGKTKKEISAIMSKVRKGGVKND